MKIRNEVITDDELSGILDRWLESFKDQILETKTNPNNSNGKGYSSTPRANTHILNDATVIKEGIRWSHDLEKNEPYFLHLDMFGNQM